MSFDFAAITAPFRMQPGLRRMAPGSGHLTPNRPGDAVLRAKLAVLSTHAEQALCAASGKEDPRALDALCAQAEAEHPDALVRQPAGGWFAPWLGWGLRGDEVVGDGPPAIGDCLCALPRPWRRAGLLSMTFAEDFALIDGHDAHIPWLAVCLPSHWVPQHKVGRHFAEVHAPVADNQLLLKAAESLARLVSGPDRWERFVWTLTPQPAFDAHPLRHPAPPWSAEASAGELAATTWLRTEHQTFIPVPALRQAVFTIQVELRPLVEVASQAQALHEALATMSPAVLAYRSLAPARERLLAWLSAQHLRSGAQRDRPPA